uniref:Small integral membrane protein 15 n=1 Tax=Trichobilharzia regenti TaxID=157069 RepID=A0AA85JTL6_TRIRE|nr:unnamed protein product [Trichobilharzia regenti]
MDHRTPEPSGADSVDPVKNLDLGQPPEDWSGWFSYMALKFVLYVAKNPWEFLTSTMIILTPLMLICAYCSYKLAKEIKRQEEASENGLNILRKLCVFESCCCVFRFLDLHLLIMRDAFNYLLSVENKNRIFVLHCKYDDVSIKNKTICRYSSMHRLTYHRIIYQTISMCLIC